MAAQRSALLPLDDDIAHLSFLSGYNSLPIELKDYCFELACSFFAPSASSAPRPLYDVPTCLNLSLVSKQLTQRVRPLLYRQVSITRPSALYALHETLEAHPERGKLIKNLHIGNTTALPAHWWPISDAYPDRQGEDFDVLGVRPQSYTWLASSLERSRLPSECGVRQAWAVDRRTSGCREAAVQDALIAAQSDLDIDLLKEGKGDGPLRVGAILEVQAALDLYLERLRADEEARPELKRLARPGARVPIQCRQGRCHHYPALVITEVSVSQSRTHRPRTAIPPGALVLSRRSLLRHLARPGATTDRFDHPLTLARSGYDVTVTAPPGKGHPGHRDGVGARYRINNDEFFVDKTNWDDGWELHFADLSEIEEGSGVALNAALLHTATLGLNQNLAKAVMKLTPGVRNLSLTGALQRCIRWTHFKRENVRRMTVGPRPPWWSYVTQPDIAGLKNVEELRIGGTSLYDLDRTLIATMRKLRRFEWSMGERWPSTYAVGVQESVQILINTPVPALDASEAEAQDSQGTWANDGPQQNPEEDEDSGKGSSPSPLGPYGPPLTVIRLHNRDVNRVLCKAPTPNVREAWLHGRDVEGIPRRLQLVAKDIEVRRSKRPTSDDTEPSWDVLYREGRDWWLEGAV